MVNHCRGFVDPFVPQQLLFFAGKCLEEPLQGVADGLVLHGGGGFFNILAGLVVQRRKRGRQTRIASRLGGRDGQVKADVGQFFPGKLCIERF